MNFLKNIVIGIVVLALSSGIFFFLLQDQDVKESILRSTLELFGDELLAMVPEGDQRDALSAKLDDFIVKAENNELSEDQVQVTLARALNMQSAPEKPSPEEWHALFDASLDSVHQKRNKQWRVGERKERVKFRHEIKAERLARNYQEMVVLRRDIEKVCQEDSACREFYQRAMFVANDGLRLLVDSNIDKQHFFEHHPDMRRRLENLSKDELVQFEDFAQVPHVVQQSLFHFAPMIPQSIRAEIVINSDMDFEELAIEFSKSFLNEDSLTKFINEIVDAVEEFE